MSVKIICDHVVKKYGEAVIIPDLSLEIHEGEFFTLLGPSGCGKTTLLRMIAGFNSIEGGEIRFNDTVINSLSPAKRNIGMVFQNYAIFPHMNVKKNVAFGLTNRHVPPEEIEKRVAKMLATVRIEALQDRMPERLSGGQQQRVALARAIVIEPNVLLMDEPLSNLDAKLRVEMRNAIKEIQKSVNITTVYVTHDQEEAMAVSDRIAIMKEGIIQQTGAPREIYKRPANVFVATFIGHSTVMSGVLRKTELDLGGWTVNLDNLSPGTGVSVENESETALPGETAVKVSIRPEEFYLSDDVEGLHGEIGGSVFLGFYSQNFVKLDNGSDAEFVVDHKSMEREFKPGDRVTLKADIEKINVFDETGTRNLLTAA
ncbi:MAG: ABC transporter ATP-binding protein [Spirochaetaceae bacterium]|jgi:iron(III) transport system ATP-binding protein|nr:ABC transporter ATP-binding protein [Spirochaetaceae bacterium]